MKNSAAAPSGAAEKRRLKDLTKLMLITFARYLASLAVHVALIPVGSIDSFTPVHSASRLAHLCRSIPIGSIDSFAPALSAVRPARLSRSIPIGSVHRMAVARVCGASRVSLLSRCEIGGHVTRLI